MGAVASPTALARLLRIAAVPSAAFLAFTIWWLAGCCGQSTMRVLIVVGGLGFPSFAAVSAGLAARRSRGRHWRVVAVMAGCLGGWAVSELLVMYLPVWIC